MEHTHEFICQSCGMPMVAMEHFGTNQDQSANQEYCIYCYQNGDFCDRHTFEETIEEYLKDPDSVPVEEGCVLSEEEKALHIRMHLITLKRWNVKHHTQESYFRAVYQAIEYIRHHLSVSLDLNSIAQEVGISRFHFHRIFKAIMNESPGEFIQRLRLENAAFLLVTTRLTLAEIALRTGYQTEQSLSRSFKKQYQLPPSVYRRTPCDLSTPIRLQECILQITPEFHKLQDIKAVGVKTGNPFKRKDAFTAAWSKLMGHTGLDGVPDQHVHYYTISWDAPIITDPERQITYVCVEHPSIKKDKLLQQITLPGGLYAVFPVKGAHSQLKDAYCYIYRYWLPNSEYEVRDCSKFEKYLSNPGLVKEEDILTEIYIPVRKKSEHYFLP